MPVEKLRIEIGHDEIEIYMGGGEAGSTALTVCALHPAEAFGEGAVELLAAASGAQVVCASPRSLALEGMVNDLEALRWELGLDQWVFWGMSGGGWLAQIYARRYPDALAGIIVEGACACFRERLADPACMLSPFHPGWRTTLENAGLLDPESHREPSLADESEWIEIRGVGSVFRRRDGPALLVSPMPVSEGMRRVMPELWKLDSRAWLSTIRVPTLVLSGTMDPVVPIAHARAVHEAIAGSRWVPVEGAGHVPVAEKRPEVAEAVRSFLAGLPC
ncbi:MAG: alpha/beta fold hydrolase [Thermoanaerobaculia bacterium]